MAFIETFPRAGRKLSKEMGKIGRAEPLAKNEWTWAERTQTIKRDRSIYCARGNAAIATLLYAARR